MGHERFAVVLADVTLRVEPGLAPEIAGELAAVSVLNYNDILLPKDPADLSGVEGNDPFYLKVVGHDAFFAGKFLDGFTNHALGRAPADESDSGILGTEKLWRGDIVDRSLHFAAAFLDHHPALVRGGEFVADNRAVFVVLVGRRGGDVARDARDPARWD